MRAARGSWTSLKSKSLRSDNTAIPLITAVNDRNFWPQLLEQLNSRLPESDIWITELAATSGGKLLGVSEKRAAETAATPPPTQAGPKGKTLAAGANMIDGINVRGLYLYNPNSRKSLSITFATSRTRHLRRRCKNARAFHKIQLGPERTDWCSL